MKRSLQILYDLPIILSTVSLVQRKVSLNAKCDSNAK